MGIKSSRSCISALSRACMHACVALRLRCVCVSPRVRRGACGSTRCDRDRHPEPPCVSLTHHLMRGAVFDTALALGVAAEGNLSPAYIRVSRDLGAFGGGRGGGTKVGLVGGSRRGSLEGGQVRSVEIDILTHSASISVRTMVVSFTTALQFVVVGQSPCSPFRTKSALLMPSLIFSSSRRPALAMKALCRRGRKNW